MGSLTCLWCVPRSRLTAFEWMIGQRGDFVTYHEPFGEAYYLGEDRRSDRHASEEPISGLTYESVWAELQEASKAKAVFVKDHAFQILHMADRGFIAQIKHAFLIRDPQLTLPSLHAQWSPFTLSEAGFEAQHALYDRVLTVLGEAPPVIDAEDLAENPEATVRAYCNAMGISFKPEALSWDRGERPELGNFEGGRFLSKLRASTGLSKQQSKYACVEESDFLRRMHEKCKPHYDALFAHRLPVS